MRTLSNGEGNGSKNLTLKKAFALFQALSFLFHVVQFVTEIFANFSGVEF